MVAGEENCEAVKAYSDGVPNGKAGGKGNVSHAIEDPENKYSLIIADSIGFGADIGECTEVLKYNPTVTLYLIESFEKMILDSRFIQQGLEGYDEADRYLSPAPIETKNCEAYYTDRLKELMLQLMAGKHMTYSKKGLPRCLSVECCKIHGAPCMFFDASYTDLRTKLRMLMPEELYQALSALNRDLQKDSGGIEEYSMEDLETHLFE